MKPWLDLLVSERWTLLEATAAHLELVVEAVLLAVLVGVPLGILAARRPVLERLALGVAGVLQTIPSLALLGFLLIAFRGQIGRPPALTALLLYALLPIVKNTVLGLKSIDPAIREAAIALGMTAWQRLRLVELPLAVPICWRDPCRDRRFGRDGDDRGRHRCQGPRHLHLSEASPSPTRGLSCSARSRPRSWRCSATRRWASRAAASIPTKPSHSRLRTCVRPWSALLLAFAAWGMVAGTPAGQPRARTTDHRLQGRQRDDHPGPHACRAGRDPRGASGQPQVQPWRNAGLHTALRQGGLDAYVEYTGTALTTILKEPVQNDPDAVLGLVRAF